MKVNKISLWLLVAISISIAGAFGKVAEFRELSVVELSAIRGGSVEGQPCDECESWCACWENECDEVFACIPVWDADPPYDFVGWAESYDTSDAPENCLYTTWGEEYRCDIDWEEQLVPACFIDVWYTDGCSGDADLEDQWTYSRPCSTYTQ